MPRKRFRIYIDESGDHAYKRLLDPANRYLGLTGCFFEKVAYRLFWQKLEALKQKYFTYDPDFPLVLHREDLINRRGPFGILCDEEICRSFDDDLIKTISEGRFRIITVVIDKKSHIERYEDAAFHPYHYCLAALLERYCGYLNFVGAEGDVLAESRGGKEDMQLKEAYKRVYESGTQWRKSKFFKNSLTSKEIKLNPKRANIAGLQLADILAHPIKQEILFEKGEIQGIGQSFGRRLCETVSSKYNVNVYQDKIEGYGKIFLK